MPTAHESTTVLLDPRNVQTGVCILDGQILCGLFLTTKYESEIPEYIEVCGIRKPVLKMEPERLNGTLVVHRTKSGMMILRPKRNGMYVHGRRLRKLEREHRGIEFKFLPLSAVDPFAFKTFGKGWLELTRTQRWEVSAAIADSLRYHAVEADLPAFIATPKPRPTTPRVIPTPKPPQPKTQNVSETHKFLRILFGILGLIGLVILPFALLRGLEVAFNGFIASLAAYGVLGYAVIRNRQRAVVTSEERF
ncbi:MAG: hypothetical protein WBL50_10265 [Candidatus Acidiferrum sp.]